MTGLLFEYAEQQAEARPSATAIRSGSTRLTYSELATRSSRLARLLLDGGCRPGDRVGIVMPKSPMAIVAMHAAMKAGGVYVPVDVANPAARVARVLSASEPRWLLAAGPVAELLDKSLAEYPHDPPKVGWLESEAQHGSNFRAAFVLSDVESAPSTTPSPKVSADDAAHILFTSGSTGVPKGVVITHANVTSFVEWAIDYFGMGVGDRVSGHSPLHFDLSSFDIYGAFAAGSELHQVPPDLNLMPPRVTEFIRTSRLTQWFSVPSILSYLAKFDAVKQGDFPELRRLLWCGEVFPTPQLQYWMERLPHVTFTNLYGPTEATIASSYHTLDARPASTTESIPIGEPCRGEELLVLDDAMDEAPRGSVGDLYIGGVGLSPGYWRDQEATSRAFRDYGAGHDRRVYRTGDLASRRDDGLVYFHGRSDTQIKSRGHRIELGEIETALSTITELGEVAVVAVETGGFEGFAICCAFVRTQDSTADPRSIRLALRETIPSYMMPSKWLDLDVLPKNANGKIDKPAIRDRFKDQV